MTNFEQWKSKLALEWLKKNLGVTCHKCPCRSVCPGLDHTDCLTVFLEWANEEADRGTS